MAEASAAERWLLRDRGVTRRESEVLDALAERLTNAEIASRLFISERTVESHVGSLLRKLVASDRRELATIARESPDRLGADASSHRPTGTVTFLFTDIVGSTSLWEWHPEEMCEAVEQHDALLRRSIGERSGQVFSTGGDGLTAVFARAEDAVVAAVTAQAALVAMTWPISADLRVRMGVHTGEAHERGGDYFGPAVNRAARIKSASAGGQILVSSTTAELVRDLDTIPSMVDLGEQRLPGLRRGQRLYDVLYDGRPPLPQHLPGEREGNLVSQITNVIGRDEARATVLDSLQEHRLVTLVGVGGIGKTTLAEAAAAETGFRFADGTWLIELALPQSGDAVPHAFASTLRVQPQGDRSVTESIVESYRDLRALLLVDNCEHVIDEAADVIGMILRGCDNVRVLATSREPLGISGEQRVDVAALTVPNHTATVSEIESSSAVQLFLSRAAEAGREIELNEVSAPIISGLCQLLGGIPLAIELAAGRSRAILPSDMFARLRTGVGDLADQRRDIPERHRPRRAPLDWSYRLLTSDEQLMFSRLAVFLGGFTLTAAEAVCTGEAGDMDVADVVWRLVDRSLIQVDDDHETTRYVMLEPVRQYALEHVEKAELLRLAGRHLVYFRDLAESSLLGIKGPNEATWVRRLNAEFENLRAALFFGVESARVDDAARLVSSLHDYAMWRQRFELAGWADAVLDLHGAEAHPAAPVLFATAGWGRCIAGDFDGASTFAERGLLAERDGAPECGWLHDVLAHAQFFQGSPDGLPHSHAEIDRARRAGDRYRLAYVLADNGAHEFMEGNAEIGATHAEEAFELAQAQGCPSLISMACVALSMVHIDDDPQEARRIAIDGARIAGSVEAGWARNVNAMWLILLSVEHGDPAYDLARARDALDDYRRAGDDVRVRNAALWSLPALNALMPDSSSELARLYGSIVDRPVMRANFADARLEPALAELRARMGRRFADAVSEGQSMTTSQSARLGIALLDQAIKHQEALGAIGSII